MIGQDIHKINIGLICELQNNFSTLDKENKIVQIEVPVLIFYLCTLDNVYLQPDSSGE